MDATEDEGDVKLQRASADLLADLQRSLHPFLWQKLPSGAERIRRRVRIRERDRLVALLEPFQELPQLLDPHLAQILPALAEAFLVCLQSKRRPYHTDTKLLIPLQAAMCSLLYTICKIRGEKVVVRFFNTEVRYLEVLLSAIEADKSRPDSHEPLHIWTWEERYITLLWLSQLLLAPFDLSSISSQEYGNAVKSEAVPGLSWPTQVPSIASRVLLLAIHHLSSSGKERDAAKILLVRVAMRRDMQQIGVLQSLVQWALYCLRPSDLQQPIYHYIGVLSFLAGLLNSSDFATMSLDMPSIFQSTQEVTSSENPLFQSIKASSVARKIIIKILRSLALLYLQRPSTIVSSEVIETVIGHMLESLADSATPVRLAASKALSMITLKLDPDMAAQVVEAALDALKQGVVSSGNDLDSDLSKVNPLEWHGLIMTLSHLLYRRSPPATTLADILPVLLTGLSFEQRSATGASVGTNVRDAACFGIWALARRYSTAELQSVSFQYQGESAILQVLATQLVTAASLDPAGNIRRGASAALQELIGRHPNTITEGINVVQVVDYHAVALRSRAVAEVAYKAAQLSPAYREAVLNGLLGWRGVGDADASARRNAAAAVGRLVWLTQLHNHDYWLQCSKLLTRIQKQIDGLKTRQIDERHGLILCKATIISHPPRDREKEELSYEISKSIELENLLSQIMSNVVASSQDALHSIYRRPELLAEAVCELLVASYPMMLVDVVLRRLHILHGKRGGAFSEIAFDILQSISNGMMVPDEVINTLDVARKDGTVPNQTILQNASELLSKWLPRNETAVVRAASEAAVGLLTLCDGETREAHLESWIQKISMPSRGSQEDGFLHAVFAAFPLAASLQPKICAAVHERWHTGHDIDTRSTILRCLAKSDAIHSHQDDFIDLIVEGLDDYTTNARGNVGSLVRIEATGAAAAIWRDRRPLNDGETRIFKQVFGKILRLATEKLDKVRIEAQHAVASAIRPEFHDLRTHFQTCTPSSHAYFKFLLELKDKDCLMGESYNDEWFINLVEGYVTSSDTGSEELVKNSRAALADFCEDGNVNLVGTSLVEVLKRNMSNDRVLVPTLEILAFLFNCQLLQDAPISWRTLHTLLQKSHFKTGNVKKLEASIKLYGNLVEVYPEALQKLSSMLLHPFPKVRNHVADTLFVVRGVGKGVDWTKAKRDEADFRALRAVLGLV